MLLEKSWVYSDWTPEWKSVESVFISRLLQFLQYDFLKFDENAGQDYGVMWNVAHCQVISSFMPTYSLFII